MLKFKYHGRVITAVSKQHAIRSIILAGKRTAPKFNREAVECAISDYVFTEGPFEEPGFQNIYEISGVDSDAVANYGPRLVSKITNALWDQVHSEVCWGWDWSSSSWDTGCSSFEDFVSAIDTIGKGYLKGLVETWCKNESENQ